MLYTLQIINLLCEDSSEVGDYISKLGIIGKIFEYFSFESFENSKLCIRIMSNFLVNDKISKVQAFL